MTEPQQQQPLGSRVELAVKKTYKRYKKLYYLNLFYSFRPCKKLDKSSVKFEKPTFGSEVICKTAFRSLLAVKKKVTSQQETRAAIIKFKAFKMV